MKNIGKRILCLLFAVAVLLPWAATPGAVHGAEESEESPAVAWNLVLDGNIGMNFVLNVTEEEAATASIAYTINGETTTRQLNGATEFTIDLAAAQLTDLVTLVLTTETETFTKTYSGIGYVESILYGDYDVTAKNLVRYLLTYCAASQKYFDYHTDYLADYDVTVDALEIPAEGAACTVTGEQEGVYLWGAALVHENKIAVRFYFHADSTDGLTFSHPYTQKGEFYCIEIADICPQELDQPIEVSVGDLTVSYSPLDYIIRMYAKGGSTADLVQALYGYHIAAKTYIHVSGMTYKKFIALPSAERRAFQEGFYDLSLFFQWYEEAKEKYENENPSIIVGGDGTVIIP